MLATKALRNALMPRRVSLGHPLVLIGLAWLGSCTGSLDSGAEPQLATYLKRRHDEQRN
jgi:hypothetical protein